MPLPTLGDVHVNRPLTMMSVGYLQDQKDFVASEVFPAIPVPMKSDLYFVYNRGDYFRNNMQLRAPGTPAAAGGYKLATQTYVANVWAEKKIIDDQIRANSDQPLQPDAARVPSPTAAAPALIPDLIIAPLLAFDRAGFRLGQGGGYYDRTLQALRAAGPVFVVGLAYAGQEVEAAPRDDHDQPLDAILTETGYHRFRKDI